MNTEEVASLFGYSSQERYHHRAEFVFQGIDVEGKRVLEIGAGKGAFCIWAGLHGAEYVLGLEPESDGSSTGSSTVFRKAITELELHNVEWSSRRFENLSPADGKFDVVLLYNVINHLDEEAVQRLNQDQSAVVTYRNILKTIRDFMNQEGTLLIADSGRTNFWPKLGRPSPFAHSIEWQKHQDPRTWMSVLSEAGFSESRMKWSPLYPLGPITSNALVHFFTVSHFLIAAKNG